MENSNITVVYSQEKRRLTIFQDGKPVGGFVGDIAIIMFRRIAFNNAKISIENGNLQPIV